MPFFVFEKLLFDFYVRKNQNLLTFLNVMIFWIIGKTPKNYWLYCKKNE